VASKKDGGDPMVAKWKQDVYDRQGNTDYGGDRSWFDVAYGFALAHGFEPEKAYDWAMNLGEQGLLL